MAGLVGFNLSFIVNDFSCHYDVKRNEEVRRLTKSNEALK